MLSKTLEAALPVINRFTISCAYQEQDSVQWAQRLWWSQMDTLLGSRSGDGFDGFHQEVTWPQNPLNEQIPWLTSMIPLPCHKNTTHRLDITPERTDFLLEFLTTDLSTVAMSSHESIGWFIHVTDYTTSEDKNTNYNNVLLKTSAVVWELRKKGDVSIFPIDHVTTGVVGVRVWERVHCNGVC